DGDGRPEAGEARDRRDGGRPGVRRDRGPHPRRHPHQRVRGASLMAAKKRKKAAAKAPAPMRPKKASSAGATPKRASRGTAARTGRGRPATDASNRVMVGEGEIDVPSIERLVRLMAENDLLEIEVQ